MSKSVLFISHDASRTGAPIVLLHLLRWIKDNSNISFQIILRNGGELEEEFRAIAPTFIFSQYRSEHTKKNDGLAIRALRKVARLIGFGSKPHTQPIWQDLASRQLKQDVEEFLDGEKVSLIYSNTITNGEVLEVLRMAFDCPVISHIHELEWAIGYYDKPGAEKTLKYTHHYIACSEAVRQNLTQNHGIEPEKLTLIHEFVSTLDVAPYLAREHREKVCKDLGIPPSSLLIGASGTIHWRKGPDLFIQLAKIVLGMDLGLPIHFLWIGGRTEGTYYKQLCHDIALSNLGSHVHFLGAKSNPLDYYAIYDVFTLMSREDPFPIVCLEASLMGKPILCFDRAGGAKELVEDDCGFVVPYLNVECMAQRVSEILGSRELRQRLGQRAREKVQKYYSIDALGPKVLNTIKRHQS